MYDKQTAWIAAFLTPFSHPLEKIVFLIYVAGLPAYSVLGIIDFIAYLPTPFPSFRQ